MTFRASKGERGSQLIEFALVFPMLLLVMLGIIDFGFLFQRYEVLTNAAREGARVAVLPGYSTTDVQTRVSQYLVAGGLTTTITPPAVSAATSSIGGSCMTLTTVTVIYPHTFLFLGPIVGLMGGSGFTSKTLQATATMRNEVTSGGC